MQTTTILDLGEMWKRSRKLIGCGLMTPTEAFTINLKILVSAMGNAEDGPAYQGLLLN